MLWLEKAHHLIHQPVGISLANGQGTSGILCSIDGGKVAIIEYMYHSQFALKRYHYHMIQDINGFPPCH